MAIASWRCWTFNRASDKFRPHIGNGRGRFQSGPPSIFVRYARLLGLGCVALGRAAFGHVTLYRVRLHHRERFLHRGHELRGEDDGRVLLGGDFGHRLQGSQLQRDGVLRDDVGGFAKLDGRLELALGGDNLGAALAFGLGLFGHCALHVFGKDDVLDFDSGDLRAPRLGVRVDDVLDLLVDVRGLGQQLIEAEAPDHVAHRGLADLVDRVVDALDRDHGFFRIGDMIVSDRCDIDRDIVFGDDFLRRNLHRDGSQGHTNHLLDGNEYEREPGSAYPGEFSELKYDAALVLAQDADCSKQVDDDRDDDNGECHGTLIAWIAIRVEARGRHAAPIFSCAGRSLELVWRGGGAGHSGRSTPGIGV